MFRVREDMIYINDTILRAFTQTCKQICANKITSQIVCTKGMEAKEMSSVVVKLAIKKSPCLNMAKLQALKFLQESIARN